MQIINFKHYYYKLVNDEFTTIRGKSNFNKYSIGEIVLINKEKKPYCKAIILEKELRRIIDLDFEFLKEDSEYKGFTINNKNDFVDLINGFLPNFYTKSTIYSEKTILYLKKC
jgi:hypothetical protein